MATKNRYLVNVKGNLRNITATSEQSAVRKVIRILIRDGILKTQPKTDLMGWWEGVSCEKLP